MEDRSIELTNVSAVYEGESLPALHEINLTIEHGEIAAIVGPNGAGKTTLLEVINGLLPITSGRRRVLGEIVTSGSHRLRQQIAYLPQDLAFDPVTPFLARDVVLMGRFAQLGPFRLPRRDDRAAISQAMASVGIDGLSRRPIGRLSGGQQRKVLLARVIARHPQILLLDEPMANLDPDAKSDISHLILRIHAELSLSTLFVSHESGPLLDSADRIVTLEGGRIVETAVTGARTL